MRSEEDIKVIGPRDPRDKTAINCCSIAKGWQQGLSPFLLGPVELWDTRTSRTMENAWQYSKIYDCHLSPSRTSPTAEWLHWSQRGFNNRSAIRYPMGRNAIPHGSWFENEIIGYVTARRALYWPLYRDAVRYTDAFRKLQALFISAGRITLWDFDGYNRGNQTLLDVVDNPNRKMGHAFVLAAMLAYGSDIQPMNLP